MSINSVPREILIKIFALLEKTDLGSCCQVSPDWLELASDNHLWRKIARQMFKGEFPKESNIKACLTEFSAHNLHSNEEIIDHIQSLISRVPLGQNARFRCLIGIGPSYQTICVKIIGRSDQPPLISGTKFDIIEDYIAKNIGSGSLLGFESSNCHLRVFSKPNSSTPHYFTSFPHSNVDFRSNRRNINFSSQTEKEFVIACSMLKEKPLPEKKIFNYESLSITLTFPQLTNASRALQTDMECQIITLAQRKIEDWKKEKQRRILTIIQVVSAILISSVLLSTSFSIYNGKDEL